MRTYLRTLILATLLAVPLCAAAGPVADAENYKPSPFANDRLSLIGGEMMESLSFGMGLFLDYERNPVIITNTVTDRVMRTVVGNHLTADLTLSLGLFEWVDLALAVPTVMFQDGDGWNDADGLPTGSLGDIRFAARIRLHRTEKRLFSLALVPAFTFPTGQSLHDLSGANGMTFSPTIAMSIVSRWVDGGLDLYYRMTQKDTVIGTTRIADQVGVRLLVTAYAIPEVLGFNTEFLMATTAGKTFGDGAESPMEATLSGTWRHAPANIALTVGGGAGIIHGFATPQFRVFAGLTWTLKHENEKPAPEKEDIEDETPTTKIIPAPRTMTSDAPALTPKKNKVIEFDIASKEEKKEAKKSEAAEKPKTADLQSKSKEAAPTPAPVVAPAPKKPAPAPAPVKKLEPRTGTPMAEVIYFKENSAEFTDDSRVKLEKLNLLLSANFTLRIRVEGHCDRLEKPDLGLKRAQALKLWFVDRDIESKRILTMGLGADEPVASSDLESDRTRNRRATFFVLDN